MKEKGEESLSTLCNFIVYLNPSGRQLCNYVRYLFRNLKKVLGLFCVVGFCSSLLSYYCRSSVYANQGIHHECVVLPRIVDTFQTTHTTPLDLISIRNLRCRFEEEGYTIWHARFTLCQIMSPLRRPTKSLALGHNPPAQIVLRKRPTLCSPSIHLRTRNPRHLSIRKPTSAPF